MPHLSQSLTLKCALLLGICSLASSAAAGQALITAGRGGEFTPFAQTTLVDPDWGGNHNLGYTVGLDYTRFFRSLVQPSLEARMTSANGTVVNERSYVGGFKLAVSLHGVQPYATILGGRGEIFFNYPNNGYTSDNSFVYSLGAGAEFNVTSQLAARVDFTHQQWNLDPQTLTPTTFGVGLAYRIPFHVGRVE